MGSSTLNQAFAQSHAMRPTSPERRVLCSCPSPHINVKLVYAPSVVLQPQMQVHGRSKPPCTFAQLIDESAALAALPPLSRAAVTG